MSVPLAYAILAHHHLGHAERLVRAIHTPEDIVVVHVDRKVREGDIHAFRARLEEFGNVHIISEIACRWGGYSVVEATIRCLEHLVASAHPYAYVSLLSGVDYPTRGPAALKRFLAANAGKEFMQVWGEISPRDRERYTVYWPAERLVARNRARRLWVKAYSALGRPRRLPRALVPVFGSQWFTVSREAAHHLCALAREPDITRFFRKSAIPDEMMLQTLLASSPYGPSIANDNLRYVTAAPDGRFPKTLTLDDFEHLDRDGVFFCRKIEPGRDGGLCDHLDRTRLSLRPARACMT